MLLGFTIGSNDLIRTAGFSDRATARKTHYLRAKALYDADYETDRMTLAAVLLLLGFWWAGPEDQKDTCYWVACATTLAQQLGMHRSYVELAISMTNHITESQQYTSLIESPDRGSTEANLVVNLCNSPCNLKQNSQLFLQLLDA